MAKTTSETPEAQFIENVPGLGEVYRAIAPFDASLDALRAQGVKSGYPISVRDESYKRLHGQDTSYTRTCHAPILAKDKPVIIARLSPLVLRKNRAMLQQAIASHRKREYPSFPRELYEQWEAIAKADEGKTPEKARAIKLSQRQDFRIVKESNEARFWFQDTREGYFDEHAPKEGIYVAQIDPSVVDAQKRTIINYLWFDNPSSGSSLSLRGRSLDYGGRTSGVKRVTGEASCARQTNSKATNKNPHYDPRLLKQSTQRLSKIRQNLARGRLDIPKLNADLESIAEFLDSIKQ